jgi:hypothetical protein
MRNLTPGATWIDMNQARDSNPDIGALAERMSRLMVLATTGVLVDTEDNLPECSDIVLLQELAWAVNTCVEAAARRLENVRAGVCR